MIVIYRKFSLWFLFYCFIDKKRFFWSDFLWLNVWNSFGCRLMESKLNLQAFGGISLLPTGSLSQNVKSCLKFLQQLSPQPPSKSLSTCSSQLLYSALFPSPHADFHSNTFQTNKKPTNMGDSSASKKKVSNIFSYCFK